MSRALAWLEAWVGALRETDAELRAATPSPIDLALVLGRRRAADMLAAACRRFSARIALRSQGRALTYAELWRRAAGLSVSWRVRPGERIAIHAANSVGWVIADLACFHAGAVSVPIPVGMAAGDVEHILAETRPARVLRDADLLGVIAAEASEAPPAKRAAGDLASIVYTSGSTGRPKGVMLTHGRWAASLRSGARPRPTVGVVYLPLSHMAGRLAVHRALVTGGVTHLAAADTLFEEVRAARPTELLLVPRVAVALERRGGDLRGVLGDRLRALVLGSAPTAPETVELLRRTFGVPVHDSYGSTETGPLTLDQRVGAGVAYRLIDHPELGYTRADRPYPRGELAVKTRLATPGYYRDPAASAALRAGGFIKTGDIVEERARGRLVWIERAQSVLRLAHGEFVSPARLEALFAAGSPIIEALFIYARPVWDCLLAVVFSQETDKARLRAEIDRVALAAGLSGREVPRDFLIVDADAFPGAGEKPQRRALLTAYGAALDGLYQQVAARKQPTGGGGDLRERVVRAVAATLGLDADEVGRGGRDLQMMGLDSLAATALAASIADSCGSAPPASFFLQPAVTVDDVVRRVESLPPADLSVVVGDAPAAPQPPAAVLLTGATGFLGRFLLLELLERLPRVVCVVRAASDADAAARVERAFAGDDRLRARFGAAAARLEARAGDLTRPGLGLPPGLAGEVDSVVHAGALVNHLLGYADLFEPNVLGTVEVMRFAVAGRRKPIHFVSSIGGPGGASGDYAAGYLASKRAGEGLLAELHGRAGLPIAVYRCSLLLGHRRYRGQVNAGDVLSRLLRGIVATGLAPESFYAGAPAGYDAVPVDAAAAAIAALALQPTAGHRSYHVGSDPAHPVSLDDIVGWIETGGHPLERLPFAAWLAQFRARLEQLDDTERRRSALPILHHWSTPRGPSAAPADQGVSLGDGPLVDEAFVHHCLRSL